jgi:hypothetical protein
MKRGDERARTVGDVKPGAIAGCRVEIESRLPHGESVAEIGAGGIAFAMAEAAAFDGAIGQDVVSGTLGGAQSGLVSGGIVEGQEPADRPAVLARVDIRVDTRLSPKPCPLLRAQRIEALAGHRLVHVRVLARIEGALRPAQLNHQEALEVLCGNEVFRVFP